MKLNDHSSVQVTVNKDNCASAVGSGALDVFSTPSMVALMENAACEVIKDDLEAGQSSVGTKVDIAHLKATPLGDTVTATATLVEIDGRRLVFKVSASDSRGLIGEGMHERFIISVEKFLAKLQ